MMYIYGSCIHNPTMEAQVLPYEHINDVNALSSEISSSGGFVRGDSGSASPFMSTIIDNLLSFLCDLHLDTAQQVSQETVPFRLKLAGVFKSTIFMNEGANHTSKSCF